jgi:ABC-type nitrate/sulfonate/bicarbonate transport system substrate-binding protein
MRRRIAAIAGLVAFGSLGIIIAAFMLKETVGPSTRSEASRSAVRSALMSVRLEGAFDPKFAGEMLAFSAGLFDQQELRVELRPADVDDDPIELVASGADQIGVTSGEKFLLARARGVPVVAFAAGYLKSAVVFYSLRESGIRAPADFVDRRIGYQPGRDTAVIYEAMMARFFYSRSKVHEIVVDTDIAPLLARNVDVWPGHIGAESYAMERQGIRYNVIDPGDHGIHWPGTVYFAQERTLREQPDQIHRFLRAVLAGWELAYADKEKAIPVISAFDSAHLTPEFVRFKLEQQRDFLRPLGVRFGEFDEAQWRSMQDMLLNQKIMTDSVDLSKAVSFDFIRDAYRRRTASE